MKKNDAEIKEKTKEFKAQIHKEIEKFSLPGISPEKMKEIKKDIAMRVKKGRESDVEIEKTWDLGHSGLIKPLILFSKIEQEPDIYNIGLYFAELNNVISDIKIREEKRDESKRRIYDI